MIIPDEHNKSQNAGGVFDPHAGIVSPPPSYELVSSQPGGTRPHAMPTPHPATMHSSSLPPPSSRHETQQQHHYGRHQTMPEPSRFGTSQPSQDMAAHLDNVRFHEVQKVRVDEERRMSQYGVSSHQSPLPSTSRRSFYTENTDVSSIPTQDTGTSMDKSFVALNPNPPMPPPPGQVRTQPTFQNSMSMRNIRRIPTNTNGDREWSHGCCKSMCQCDGCGMCCCATWCPCVAYSKIKSRMSHLERNNYPHPSGGDGCTSDCFIHGVLTSLCGIGWVMQIGLRSSIRDRYRIGGGACGDLCCSACCTPCSLAQESLELELEEQALTGSGKWGSPQK